MKRYSLYGIVGLFGIWLGLWLSDMFESELVSGLNIHQENQLPTNLSRAKKIEHTDDKAADKIWLNSNALLQRVLTGIHQVQVSQDRQQDVSGAIGHISTEAVAEYEAEKSRAEEEGLAYLLEQMNRTEGAAKREVIRALWRYSARIGVPEQALVVLNIASRDTDVVVAELAKQALEDLRRFKKHLEEASTARELQAQPHELQSKMVGAGGIGTDISVVTNEANAQVKFADNQIAKKQRDIAETQTLMENLQTARDETEYNTVLDQLSMHRSETRVKAWIELVNNVNANTHTRYTAAWNLWRSSASLGDDNGSIDAALAVLARDEEQHVADMARQALLDLENFRRRQQQAASDSPLPLANQGTAGGG